MVVDLFVEDASLASVVLAWIACWAIVRPSALSVPPGWGGVLFFLGLALILVENVLRTKRRLRPTRPQ